MSTAQNLSQIDKLKARLHRLKCLQHPDCSISKICKHTLCRERPPFCDICYHEHDIFHLDLIEDVESLLDPGKIRQIKNVSAMMQQRLTAKLEEDEPHNTVDSMFEQFGKCLEDNKAKLIDCLINDVILKQNESLKAQIRSIVDKINRKYRLILETRGEDVQVVKEFLTAYVQAFTFFNEVAESIRNRTGKYSAYPQAKAFLKEVEGLFERLGKTLRTRLDECMTKEDRKPTEVGGIITAQSMQTKDETAENDDDEDCKIIKTTPASKNLQRISTKKGLSTYNSSVFSSEKEPQPIKKLKPNRTILPAVPNIREEQRVPEEPMHKSEMQIEGQDNISNSGGAYSTASRDEVSFTTGGMMEEFSNDGADMQESFKYNEKIKKDYDECGYSKEVKDLIMKIFSLRLNKKYIVKLINTTILKIRQISKDVLERATKTFQEIYTNIVDGNETIVAKLSADFYAIIPFRYAPTLNTVDALREKLPILESLHALRCTLDVLTGPKEDNNYIVDHYKKLKCSIEVVSKTSHEYKVIQQYLRETGPPKTGRVCKINIINIFQIERENEARNYLEDYDNKSLLWCAYRYTDTVKILRDGFESIKNLPGDLYPYSKSVNFYDMANNCYPNCHASIENDQGFMFLCEVALGTIHMLDSNPASITSFSDKTAVNVAKKVPNEHYKYLNGARIPKKKTELKNKCSRYIVNDLNQIRVRYLLHVQFVYQ